jgi:TonB family protein
LEVAVLELARRASGLPATTTRAWSDLLKDPPARVRGLLLSPAATRLLSAAERGSIGQTDGERRSLASRSTPPAGASRLQTPEPYPHGFFRAVLAAADCDVAKAARQGSALGAGVLRLRPDGRPLQVTPTDSGLVQPGCVDAVRALLVTHVSEARATAGDDVRNVIIPINPDFVACREARSDEMPRDVERRDKGDNDRFEAPKKTRNVPPVYPVSAQEDKTMGVVVLESVIAPTGCVSDVRVIRGVDFRLDLSALRAVSQWRFTPTLLRGTAVPVLMTVTVQFSLSP